MSYAPILRNLPEELRFTMLELIEAVEENMRDQLAVRREDFDALHATVREVADVQYRTIGQVDRLETAIVRLTEAQERTEERVEELAEAQKRSEGRLDRLEVAVMELVEAQKRSEGRLDRLEVAVTELIEAQKQTQAVLQVLIKRVDWIEPRTDRAIGHLLELSYRGKASSYFGRLLRRARAVDINEIEDDLETRLSEDELDDLRLADILVYGRPKQRPDVEGVWLVVEVSAVVDRNDVERAQRRAAVLRKAGYPAVATVAGEERTEGAQEAARSAAVLFLQNGSQQNWEEALVVALGSAV